MGAGNFVYLWREGGDGVAAYGTKAAGKPLGTVQEYKYRLI